MVSPTRSPASSPSSSRDASTWPSTTETIRATLPLGAHPVIDRDGNIRYAFVDSDYHQRAEPSDVLAAPARPEQEALSRLLGPMSLRAIGIDGPESDHKHRILHDHANY